MAQQIQLRRDTSANWISNNPTLAEGEIGVVTDTGAYKLGTGILAWNDLPYRELSPAADVITFANQPDPTPPGMGYTLLYSKAIAGRSLIKYAGASGLNSPLQPAIFQNSLWLVQPNTTSTVSAVGGAVTSVGSISTPNPAANTFGLCSNFASTATANATCGVSQAVAPLNTSSGVMSNGGFFFVTRLWFPDVNYGSGATGSRIYVGLTSNTMAVSATADNPVGSRIGFAISTNLSETNWMLTTKDGTTETRIDTGMTFNVNTLYDFYLFTAPSMSEVYWRIDDLSNNTSVEGSTTNTLPATSTYMRGGFQLCTLTTVARNIRMKKIYIETDN